MAPSPAFPQAASHLPLADRGARLGAAIIDGLICGIAAYCLVLALTFTIGITWFLIGPLSSLLSYGIFLALNSSALKESGQTIGKKILGIRIANLDGSKPAFEQLAFRRYLFYLLGVIPFIGGLIALVDCLTIFRDNRRCLHDDFAGTIVVKA